MATVVSEPVATRLSWTRTCSLAPSGREHQTETWNCLDGDEVVSSFEVNVRVGKPLDVVGLKGTSLDEVRDYAAFLAKSANKLYAADRKKRLIDRCPCCDHSTADAEQVFEAFDIAYGRCQTCGHVFVSTQPDTDELTDEFAGSAEHAATYTDDGSTEIRLKQIVQPKLEWVIDTYRRHREGRVARAVDVGAGGGHFVEVCRRAGIDANGYEICAASRSFAQQAFDIQLNAANFLEANNHAGDCDLLTMWGLLEYTPDPRAFLQAARRRLHPTDGMLVVEVPRFDCMGSAIQKQCHETIARHMDPTSHVNCFSDQSLATLLHLCGFRPVAAWYFGMDAYEMLVQFALKMDDSSMLERLAPLLPALQSSLDAGRLCDDIIIAAVPCSS